MATAAYPPDPSCPPMPNLGAAVRSTDSGGSSCGCGGGCGCGCGTVGGPTPQATTAASPAGAGWQGTFGRKVTNVDAKTADVTTSEGNVYRYTKTNATDFTFTPPAGAKNALTGGSFFSSFRETQPDGSLFQYDFLN